MKIADYASLPSEVTFSKQCLQTRICVAMSEGLPKAYIQGVEAPDGFSKNYWLGTHTEKVELPSSEQYLKDWCVKINKLIKENSHLFITEEYEATTVDREVVKKISEGKRYDQL